MGQSFDDGANESLCLNTDEVHAKILELQRVMNDIEAAYTSQVGAMKDVKEWVGPGLNEAVEYLEKAGPVITQANDAVMEAVAAVGRLCSEYDEIQNTSVFN